MFQTLSFLGRKVGTIYKAPAYVHQWHFGRRSSLICHMGFPSRRGCIGAMKGSCLARWVQFLLMPRRNFTFLGWEPTLFLINLGSSGEVPNAATGPLSFSGKAK